MKHLYLAFLFTFLTACQNTPNQPLEVVQSIELQRFLGKWYEIGGIPTPEQANCTGTTATYTAKSATEVDVLNRCFEKSLTGREISAKGRAYIPNPAEPTKLKVEFFWPFAGDYQIMALDAEYQYAMIGTPSRRYLWVLSRSPELPESTWQKLIDNATAQGYDAAKIIKTLQK
jgi:apolipoprotein D and lipocalin family protein